MINPTLGRTVKMFLVDGHVDGLVTAEVMNWTGHVVSIPRPLLPRLKTRPEAERTGIYLLLGEENGRRVAYIGETDEMYTRLAQHAKDAKQDFFSRIVVITSTSDALTKAHARRLEHLAHERASQAANYLLQGNRPYNAKLPESDATDMLSFFEQIELVLPVLGINLLQVPATTMKPTPVLEHGNGSAAISTRGSGIAPSMSDVPTAELSEINDEMLFELSVLKHGDRATAREIGGEFIVLAGSTARKKAGVRHSYEQMRSDLEKEGKLISVEGDDTHLRFAVDVAFKSPSAAGAVVCNRSSNGRTDWHVKGTKTTYAENEATRLG